MNKENKLEKLNESSTRTETYKANIEDNGIRADVFVSRCADITRSAAERLIATNAVKISGKLINKKYKMQENDVVTIEFPEVQTSQTVAENISLDIVYEDSDIIVINKPSGMVVHPAPGNENQTLVNALLYHCGDSLSGIGGVARPGIVHRIDKETSGLLVVAKNDTAHVFLSSLLKEHKISRIYTAVVLGNIKDDSDTVNAPIGRHPVDRKKMAVIRETEKKSREAITHYSVIERYRVGGQSFTLVRCELQTGRTHQIRVHMSHIGHPILGDSLYGGGNTKFQSCNHTIINGQCLHAGELRLVHPSTKEKMVFRAELPVDFKTVIEKMQNATNL